MRNAARPEQAVSKRFEKDTGFGWLFRRHLKIRSYAAPKVQAVVARSAEWGLESEFRLKWEHINATFSWQAYCGEPGVLPAQQPSDAEPNGSTGLPAGRRFLPAFETEKT